MAPAVRTAGSSRSLKGMTSVARLQATRRGPSEIGENSVAISSPCAPEVEYTEGVRPALASFHSGPSN